MGKDVTWQHLRVFILGSAVIGLAGAMLTTLDGQFTPVGYNPLPIHVSYLGDGHNWWLWKQLGCGNRWFFIWFLDRGRTYRFVADRDFNVGHGSRVRCAHLLEGAAHMRLMTVGIILLVASVTPRGPDPEKNANSSGLSWAV